MTADASPAEPGDRPIGQRPPAPPTRSSGPAGPGEARTAPTPARTARARVRAELTREIKDAARAQLASAGASGLSLRAVARELGMVSSAIYRYFPSRDDLLTALIVDAYDAIGEAAETAEAAVPRENLLGRWSTTCRAVRAWSLDHPHEYALIYGSPVPGYRAPEGTIGPATRVTLVLSGILNDGTASGALADGRPLPPAHPEVIAAALADVAGVKAMMLPTVPEEVILRGLIAWICLFGAVSFELFGHLHDVVFDHEAFFGYTVATMAEMVGIRG